MSVQAQGKDMRHLTPLLAAAASIVSTGPAYADLGDQLFKLLANDGAAGDLFGVSVAISGDITITGAFGDDSNGDFSGSAYLFDIAHMATAGRSSTDARLPSNERRGGLAVKLGIPARYLQATTLGLDCPWRGLHWYTNGLAIDP